jgi:hypothetical protein
MGVYTLKELEKLLPAIGSINGMQVKDYLQALQDEYLIRVEKIGSGNWYWSFKSDAKKGKESQINSLKAEETKLTSIIAGMEKQIKEEMSKRKDDAEELESGGGINRKDLLETHETLLKQMEVLDKELACYCDNDPEEVLRKQAEITRLKESAIRNSDNIDSLESYISSLIGDRSQLAEMMHLACGDEYVVGEGLKEL